MDKTLVPLAGGIEILANFMDGHSETVTVRQLTIRELPKYLETFTDELGMTTVELFCGRQAGWAETLTADSFTKILEAGEGLNLDPLSRYVAIQKARQKRFAPELAASMERRVNEEALKRLPPSLPGSPSSPA